MEKTEKEKNHEERRNQAWDAYFKNHGEVEKLYKNFNRLRRINVVLFIIALAIIVIIELFSIPFISLIFAYILLGVAFIYFRLKLKKYIAKAKELGLPTDGKFTQFYS